jgi:transposase
MFTPYIEEKYGQDDMLLKIWSSTKAIRTLAKKYQYQFFKTLKISQNHPKIRKMFTKKKRK